MEFSRAWQTIVDMVNGLIAAFPNMILAFIIFMLFYFAGRRTRTFVTLITEKQQKAKNLGLILGRLAQSVVVIAGLLVALTVIFPSFKPGDLIQLLGIGSVAIGFAFHDIFQNFLAGILILLTSPFRIGDQISAGDFEGTVEDIQTRATTIRTHDGRRIVIPNTDLFTQSVTVNTAFSKRRMEYEVGVNYHGDIDHAKRIILDAVNSVDGVLKDPPAEALVVALADPSVNIRVYWWTATPGQRHILYLQDKVLTALKNRLVEHDIDAPPPIQRILLKTQPEGESWDSSDGHKAVMEEQS